MYYIYVLYLQYIYLPMHLVGYPVSRVGNRFEATWHLSPSSAFILEDHPSPVRIFLQIPMPQSFRQRAVTSGSRTKCHSSWSDCGPTMLKSSANICHIRFSSDVQPMFIQASDLSHLRPWQERFRRSHLWSCWPGRSAASSLLGPRCDSPIFSSEDIQTFNIYKVYINYSCF